SDVEDDPDWYDTLDYSTSPNNPTHISGSGKDKLYEIDYSVTTCFVAPLMHFEGKREQFCVIVTFNDRTDASSTDWDTDNALKDKFIGNPSTDYRYEIIESKRVVSGDSTYFADQARILLKLERYGSSKISGLTLCS
ncbi:MAG: hypothetical protein GW761_07900, partial [Leptospira sp.]|nr:hypothetical protein [Leptospira sp.]